MNRTVDDDLVLIGTREVLHRTGLSRSQLYELMRAKQFPMPLKVGHRNRWTLTDIRDWIAKLPAGCLAMSPRAQAHQ